MKDYRSFAMDAQPALPLAGGDAIYTISKWLTELKKRGTYRPDAGKYALKVFAEALGIEFPCGHPAARAAARTQKVTATKHAPPPTPVWIFTKDRIPMFR